MAAPGALRRSKPRQARPAEGAYESGFVVRHELITRNANAREKEIEGAGYGAPKGDSLRPSGYCSDRRIASRSGSIPNHR